MADMSSLMPWKGADFIGEALRTFLFSRGSADADLAGSRDTLEYRSRALYQNAPLAGAAIDTKVINVVGTGLSCRPNPKTELLKASPEKIKEFSEKAHGLFELWAASKDCDAERDKNFYQMQELVLKTKAICGDCFALRCWHKVPSSAFGLCYKLLEGNRCRNPFGKTDTRKLAMGVENDENSAHIAYYFTKYPNFDVGGWDTYQESVRVATYDAFGIRNVVHVYKADRPNQRRGVPWLAPVIPFIKNQERFQEAVLIKAIVQSLYTVFVKTKSSSTPSNYTGNVQGNNRVTPEAGEKAAVELKSANVVELGENEEIELAESKNPNSDYRNYMEETTTEIASRLNMSSEQVLKFFKGSYNSVRAAIQESKKMFDIERANLAIDMCQPMYEALVHECVMLGVLDCPGYDDPLQRMAWLNCDWIGDAPVMLDPLKETTALKMQVDEHFKTRSQAVLETNGGEYRKNVEDLAEEARWREENGVAEPGAVNRSVSVSEAKQIIDETEDEPEDAEK